MQEDQDFIHVLVGLLVEKRTKVVVILMMLATTSRFIPTFAVPVPVLAVTTRPVGVTARQVRLDKGVTAEPVTVIGLYLDPPERALLLCCDEKGQCQALERTQPGLPLGVDARTAARAQPAFSLKNISHNFPEYRTSVLPIYENSAGEAALQ